MVCTTHDGTTYAVGRDFVESVSGTPTHTGTVTVAGRGRTETHPFTSTLATGDDTQRAFEAMANKQGARVVSLVWQHV